MKMYFQTSPDMAKWQDKTFTVQLKTLKSLETMGTQTTAIFLCIQKYLNAN